MSDDKIFSKKVSSYISVPPLEENSFFLYNLSNKFFIFLIVIILLLNIIWAVNYYSSNFDKNNNSVFIFISAIIGLCICYYYTYVFNKLGRSKVRTRSYVDQNQLHNDLYEKSKKEYIDDGFSYYNLSPKRKEKDEDKLERIFDKTGLYNDKAPIIDFDAERTSLKEDRRSVWISMFTKLNNNI